MQRFIVKNIHRFGLEPHRAQEKLGIPRFGVSNPRQRDYKREGYAERNFGIFDTE